MALHEKPIGNITLNERLNTFPLKLGIRQVCPLSPLPFNLILDNLTIAKRQGKKRYICGQKEVK